RFDRGRPYGFRRWSSRAVASFRTPGFPIGQLTRTVLAWDIKLNTMKKLPTFLVVLMAMPAMAADPHSYAEPGRFLVRHVSVDLTALFELHRLKGTTELTVERKDPTANTLTLDTRNLEIESVRLIEASG